MDEPLVSFSLNILLILRLFGALFWGFGWAAFIQWHRFGQFLVEERTWLTVVVGVAVDLAIAFPEGWGVVAAVIAASSCGIIVRSLYNESAGKKGKRIMPNKSQWSLMDISSLAMDDIDMLQALMHDTDQIPQKIIKPLSQLLLNNHRIRDKVKDALSGNHQGPINA